MEKIIRVIARMDIKGPNVVKGVNMEGLRVVGRPDLFAKAYYLDGIDEIIYIDSVASLYGRNNLKEIVQRAAQEIFVPLTVGGGIKSVDDIRDLLRAGADKVAINTAGIRNPRLLTDAVQAFGSQCIVVSIQARINKKGFYECLTDNARETTGINVMEWTKQVCDLGVGEILLTSVDQEGTGNGFDVKLVEKIARQISIPVIASGGAGCMQHFRDVIAIGKPDAVCAASVFHYKLLDYMSEKGSYKDEGNTDFLKKTVLTQGLVRKNITPLMVSELKKYLKEQQIACRLSKVAGREEAITVPR